MTISVRQREILVKTLELYIQTGTPVGSNALTDVVDASSSTIRAELSALEAEGLLTHPHTSAGRVPTDAGYRFYVDALMSGDTFDDSPGEETPFLRAPNGYGNVDELLQGVSEGMSEVTRLLAVVAGPSALEGSISRVDHLPLREGAHLIVVSAENGEASSTTITLPSYVEDGELREILAYLNAFLGGRPIGTNLELATARNFLTDYNPLAVGAVLEAVEVLGRATERGLFIRGASALLARLDDLDPASLSAVVEIFERRRWLLKLVGDALVRSASNSSGVIVSIGAESGFYNLASTSLVAAAYKHRERPYGVVTLIGPKRMEYDAAISTVRSAADTLTQHLDSRF
jgi:heat-inducible transcriptional repressor